MRYRFLKLLTILLFIASAPFHQSLLSSESDNKNISGTVKKDIQKNLYILGPGDILSINFIGAKELSSKFQILSDGNIQLPLIGSHSFEGLTLDDAKNKLIKLFSNELIRPEINLSLISMRPIKVSLVGEVYRPGVYSLNMSETSQVTGSTKSITLKGFPTLVDAIQKSGGVTLDADLSKVILYRELNGNNGEFTKVELDLLDLINTGNQINNPNLFDGDLIKILKIKDPSKSIEDLPNNLIPENINIYVVGEVDKPGRYQVAVNTTVDKAILIAGGPNSWKYQKNNIRLLRVKRDGKVQIKKLSFDNNKIVSRNRKVSLRNGDIIQINKNLFGKTTDALSTFLPPIRDIYSLYGVYKVIDD